MKRSSSNWTNLKDDFDPEGAEWPTAALHNLPSGSFEPLDPPPNYNIGLVSREWTQAGKSTKPDTLSSNLCSVIADCLSTIVDHEPTEIHQTSFVSKLFDILQVSVEAEKASWNMSRSEFMDKKDVYSWRLLKQRRLPEPDILDRKELREL